MSHQRSRTPESDRRHLLDPSRPPSIASQQPSRPGSVKSVQFAANLEGSRHRYEVEPFRGFPSKEAYQASLLAFLKEKEYFESDHQLIGFYGTKTTDDYLNRPGGWRTTSKEERQAKKEEKARRKSEALAAKMPPLTEDVEFQGPIDVADVPKQRRLSKSFDKVFGRRATAV